MFISHNWWQGNRKEMSQTITIVLEMHDSFERNAIALLIYLILISMVYSLSHLVITANHFLAWSLLNDQGQQCTIKPIIVHLIPMPSHPRRFLCHRSLSCMNKEVLFFNEDSLRAQRVLPAIVLLIEIYEVSCRKLKFRRQYDYKFLNGCPGKLGFLCYTLGILQILLYETSWITMCHSWMCMCTEHELRPLQVKEIFLLFFLSLSLSLLSLSLSLSLPLFSLSSLTLSPCIYR